MDIRGILGLRSKGNHAPVRSTPVVDACRRTLISSESESSGLRPHMSTRPLELQCSILQHDAKARKPDTHTRALSRTVQSWLWQAMHWPGAKKKPEPSRSVVDRPLSQQDACHPALSS